MWETFFYIFLLLLNELDSIKQMCDRLVVSIEIQSNSINAILTDKLFLTSKDHKSLLLLDFFHCHKKNV